MSLKMQAISLVGAAVIRSLGATWRITWENTEMVDEARRVHENFVYALWHSRLLPLTYAHRSRGVVALTSEHADGEMIGQTARRLGYEHARGSSTRGGVRAVRELVSWAKKGHDLCVTVDGPRGPIHKVKPGIIEVARQTGITILPITATSDRFKAVRSWDRFQIPHPFARVHIVHAAPITVPVEATEETLEEKRAELEEVLTEMTNGNDRRFQVGD